VVNYIDRLSSGELQNHYPDLDLAKLVPIDVIDNGETLSTVEDDSLDFIVANHFLEHCENPIGAIRNHLKKIKPGGDSFLHNPGKKILPLTGTDS
jgi:predicted SAM-dependent methyltransferase